MKQKLWLTLITYPTDLKLLNEAREKTEEMIDVMHTPFILGLEICQTCETLAQQ